MATKTISDVKPAYYDSMVWSSASIKTWATPSLVYSGQTAFYAPTSLPNLSSSSLINSLALNISVLP